MRGTEIVHPKSQDLLRRQVRAVSRNLGTSLIQPSAGESVFSLGEPELRERFTFRSQVYRSVLSARRAERPARTPKTEKYGDRIRLLNNLDAYNVQHQLTKEDRILRDDQMTAFEKLRDMLERGLVKDTGYFKFPTGWGKTVLFSEIVKAVDQNTLIVVPSLFTGTQAEEKLDASQDAIDLGRVFGGKKERHRKVTITTYASLQNDLKQGNIEPEEVKLLILDEVHLSLSKKRLELKKLFPNALILGFTATPKYSDKKQVDNFLPPLIHEESVRDSIRDGLLSPLTVYEVNVDIDMSDVRVASTGDYNDRDLARKVNVDSLNQGAVEIYQRRRFTGKPAIANCVDINHAEKLAEEFNRVGIAAEVVHGKQTPQQQRDAKERFRNGEIKVLCNADILTFGFDEPSATVCLNLRPTLSRVMAEQRGGRVLRLDENNPDKHAYVIDFIPSVSLLSHEPVRYADIIEDKARGLVHATHLLPSRERERPELTIEGMTIGIQMRELLSVFDEMMREDTLGTRHTITVDTLMALLDKTPDAIASHLPYYIRGNPRKVREIAREPVSILENYQRDPQQELTLPTDVIERMLVDTVYHHMYTHEIIQEIPQVIQGIKKVSHVAATSVPAIQTQIEVLEGLQAQAEELKSAGDSNIQLADNFARELDIFEALCERHRMSPAVQSRRILKDSLQRTKTYLIAHKEAEVRTVRKKRFRALLKNRPEKIMDVVTGGHLYEGTELETIMSDLQDTEKVKKIIDRTVARVFLDKNFQGNILTFVESIARFDRILPDSAELSKNLLRFKQLDSLIKGLVKAETHANYANLRPHEIAIFDKGYELTFNLFLTITNILDRASQFQRTLDKREEQSLTILRHATEKQRNNLRVVRNEIRDAVAYQPEQIQEFNRVYSANRDLQVTNLVQSIEANSLFMP